MIGYCWACMLDIIWNAVEDECLTVIMYLLCSIPMRFSGKTSQMIHNERRDVRSRIACPAGALEGRHSQSGATSSTQASTAGWSGLCEMSIPSGSIPMPRSNKPSAPCLQPITRTGSAWAAVKYFRDQGLLFPRRVRTGPHAGTIHWAPLIHNTVLKVLRNPRYAGAF